MTGHFYIVQQLRVDGDSPPEYHELKYYYEVCRYLTDLLRSGRVRCWLETCK